MYSLVSGRSRRIVISLSVSMATSCFWPPFNSPWREDLDQHRAVVRDASTFTGGPAASEAASQSPNAGGWVAQALRTWGVKVMVIAIPQELRDEILGARTTNA
jgi:hypothetical protein